jgi:nucleoid-associated protein YgaU
MGNFEKLVVLVVLFLSAVVLAVSLSDGEAEAGTPYGGTTAALEEPEESVPARPAPRRSPAATTPSTESGTPARKTNLLLDATVDPKPAKSAATARKGGPTRILQSTLGLKPSLVEDFMLYTVRSGDTWTSLAQRFYRDARQSTNLRAANDDPARLEPDMTILVPVYDLDAEASSRDRFAPREQRPTTEVAPVAQAQEVPQKIEPGTIYTVVDGDNLSTISKKVYGTATRWQEIFHGNRDVLESPDWLSVGMKLRIPEAGTVTVPPAEAKPAATATATETATKKPRVK